jgi:hypothetical protein
MDSDSEGSSGAPPWSPQSSDSGDGGGGSNVLNGWSHDDGTAKWLTGAYRSLQVPTDAYEPVQPTHSVKTYTRESVLGICGSSLMSY